MEKRLLPFAIRVIELREEGLFDVVFFVLRDRCDPKKVTKKHQGNKVH